MNLKEIKEEKKKLEKELDWWDVYDIKISSILYELRLGKRMTQEEFGEFIGTKQPTIAKFESGYTQPSQKLLKKIVKKCGRELKPIKLK